MTKHKVVHKSIGALREDHRIAVEAYDRSKTYYNAVAIQRTLQAIDRFFNEERRNFKLIVGGVESDIVVNKPTFNLWPINDNQVIRVTGKW